MPRTNTFRNMFNLEHFLKIETAFRKHFDLALETIDLHGKQISSHCSPDCQTTFCKLVCSIKAGQKRCIQDRIRNMHMAFETGQPYTTFCHAGIMVSCVPVMNNDVLLGGILLGKCLSERFGPVIEEDLKKRLLKLRIKKNELFSAAWRLPANH